MVSLAHQTLLGKATRTRLLGALIRQIRCISQGHCTAWVVLVSSMIAKQTGSLAALVDILQQVDREGNPGGKRSFERRYLTLTAGVAAWLLGDPGEQGTLQCGTRMERMKNAGGDERYEGVQGR